MLWKQAVLIEGVRWPYHLYYLDHDETSILGDGLASIMRDDQKMLNASIRMLLDNGAITVARWLIFTEMKARQKGSQRLRITGGKWMFF